MAVARRGAAVVILKYVYWWVQVRRQLAKTRLTSTRLPRREKKAHSGGIVSRGASLRGPWLIVPIARRDGFRRLW